MIEIIDIKELQNNIINVNNILGKLPINTTAQKPAICLLDLLNTLRDDLVVTIEYDYVDATYRDEYYRFYATKFHDYSRNCARMSFFEPGTLVPGESVDYSKSDQIIAHYLGFVVIRPIDACIGRNIISVKAKKHENTDIAICQVSVNTTVLGLKVTAQGFPHSSQDGEMMACAETSLWSIAEYYGHKYPRYKPISPSEILEAMRPSSHQRQLPSRGLTFDQISIGLKAFGFSPEVYQLYTKNAETKDLLLNEKMKEVFTCYVESGFPLAICLIGKSIGHAVVCVGRTQKNPILKLEQINGRNLFFYNQGIDEFVFNDDNFPCYQKTKIDNPTSYNSDPKWDDVILDSFIVPLPSRVYMNAYLAIHQSKLLLGNFAPDNSIVRTYLASCRSYRNHIAKSKKLLNANKQILINFELPRFVWITEFGTREQFNNGEASGIIILDATEPADKSTNSLILSINGADGIGYNTKSKEYENLKLSTSLIIERYNNLIN